MAAAEKEEKRDKMGGTIFRGKGGLYLAATPKYGYLFRRNRKKGCVIITELWGQLSFSNKGQKRLGSIPLQDFENALKDEYPECRLTELAENIEHEKKRVERSEV